MKKSYENELYEVIDELPPIVGSHHSPQIVLYLKPEQIRYLTPEQIRCLTPEQIKYLKAEQLIQISGETLVNLLSNKKFLKKLTKDQITKIMAILKKQLENFEN